MNSRKYFKIESITLLIFILISINLLGITGCVSNSYMLERIYLGRNIGDTLAVNDSVWNDFKEEVITPYFPNGFTVTKAEGQWRDSTNHIVHEQTYILEILHTADDLNAEKGVDDIISRYKSKFSQEAILKVTIPAMGDF